MRNWDIPGLFLFSLPLQLIVGHGNNGKDQVDQVEGAEENVKDEEGDVVRSTGHQGDLHMERM